MQRFPFLEMTTSIGTWISGGDALPDTGCTLGLVIPEEIAEEIDAEPGARLVEVADGREILAPAWPATVELAARSFRTEAIALGDEFLLGREVLDRLEICFVFGREVRLQFREGPRQ